MARDPFAASQWQVDDLKRRVDRIEDERLEERFRRSRILDRLASLSVAVFVVLVIVEAAAR